MVYNSSFVVSLNSNIYSVSALAIICYIVQAFFNISTIGVAPLFWMLLGLSENEEVVNELEKVYDNKR